jgi:hypothetical protein
MGAFGVNHKISLRNSAYLKTSLAATVSNLDAFRQQYAPAFICHFTVSYKINRKNTAHEFALKVINAAMSREYFGHKYNFQTSRIDLDHEYIMIPDVSYKIEF